VYSSLRSEVSVAISGDIVRSIQIVNSAFILLTYAAMLVPVRKGEDT